MTKKILPKPAKVTSNLDFCPYKAVAHQGGGNWGTAYYDTEEKAKQVCAWVHAGHNTKFNCGGRTDGVDKLDCEGFTIWAIHHHYDNTRTPSWSEPILDHEQLSYESYSRNLKTYLAWRKSKAN